MEPMSGFDKEGFSPTQSLNEVKATALIVRIALAAANEQSGGTSYVMTEKFILQSHYRGCYTAILTGLRAKKMEPMSGFDKEGFSPTKSLNEVKATALIVRIALAAANEQSGEQAM